MPRPSNTEERRQQIVEGLVVAMSRHGYERASIAEIAKAASLAPGLVHYHFENKQEILLELARHLGAQLEARVKARLERAEDSPKARLDAFIDAHLAVDADADPKAVASWVALGTEAIRQKDVRKAYGVVVERDLESLEKLVRAALIEAHGSATGAKAAAAALFAAIQGYFVLSAAAPALTPAGSAAPTVKRMAEGLLGRQLPARKVREEQ